MRETLIGFVVVSVLAGVVLGRATERARRNLRDYDSAKTAVPKGRQLARAELRKAGFTALVVASMLVVLFVGAANLPP